jgi:transposase
MFERRSKRVGGSIEPGTEIFNRHPAEPRRTFPERANAGVQRRPAMLTRIMENDWGIVLDVFRAARSRRGDKGRDDRKFLEALHYFTVHNITWRALPAKLGRWNSVWKRFWRLSRSGVFEAFFGALASLGRSAHLVQMFDSTVVRAHVSAAGAKGGSMAKTRLLPAHPLQGTGPDRADHR